jgi:hypothetical protein
MASPRTISSTSRTFWELKAEQVMDRVFSAGLPSLGRGGEVALLDSSPIDVEVRDEPPRLSAAATASPPRAATARPLVPALLLLSLLGVGSSLFLWRNWNQATAALYQERTVQLLERLRALGPAQAPEAAALPAPGTLPGQSGAAALGPDGSLPPPPPEEAWIQELAPLGGGGASASAAPPLRVPVSGTITRPAPSAPAIGSWVGGTGSSPAPVPARPIAVEPAPAMGGGGPVPELVGVVQAAGKGGSAIFQMGGSSTSAAVGETIGSTGWRLQEASGDSVVIERNGQQQRVSISGGF